MHEIRIGSGSSGHGAGLAARQDFGSARAPPLLLSPLASTNNAAHYSPRCFGHSRNPVGNRSQPRPRSSQRRIGRVETPRIGLNGEQNSCVYLDCPKTFLNATRHSGSLSLHTTMPDEHATAVQRFPYAPPTGAQGVGAHDVGSFVLCSCSCSCCRKAVIVSDAPSQLSMAAQALLFSKSNVSSVFLAAECIKP